MNTKVTLLLLLVVLVAATFVDANDCDTDRQCSGLGGKCVKKCIGSEYSQGCFNTGCVCCVEFTANP